MAAWLVRGEEGTFGVKTEGGSSSGETVVFEKREETLVEGWGLGLSAEGEGRSDASVEER